jgi:hypothetical protein
VIFNFASDHKVHFSLKIQRKTILKTAKRNTRAPGTPRRALPRRVRGHVGHPPYAPYPRRARTSRRRSDHRSLRCTGGSTPVPSVASGPCKVALIHRPAHCPWRAICRRSGARRRPCPRPLHACKWHQCDPPTPTKLPRAYIPAPAVPRVHAHPPRATAVPPLAPPVCTSLQSTPPLP